MADALKLTADLIQRRDDMRRLMGDAYGEESRGTQEIIRCVRKAKGGTLAKTVLELAKRMSNAGHDPSMLFAAFVDMCESEVPRG